MGVAKKLEGRTAHPVSQGGLCAARAGGDPGHVSPGSHRAAAEAERRARRAATSSRSPGTQAIARAGRAARCARHRRQAEGARDRHAAAAASARCCSSSSPPSSARRPPSSYELFGDDVLRRANEMSFGLAQLPTFDLAATRNYVIASARTSSARGTRRWRTGRVRPHASGASRCARSVRPGRIAHVADRRQRR